MPQLTDERGVDACKEGPEGSRVSMRSIRQLCKCTRTIQTRRKAVRRRVVREVEPRPDEAVKGR